ncbi:hypothetical protein [Lentisphaera araneosa]|uniref:hypothetical protein n=1 Tax=Lentisphaera araneosa TaxID=256847 RepID=UPI0012FAB889|nr:hypothetical protein [Lentisphaera araneosa]
MMTDDQGNNRGYEGNAYVRTLHINCVEMNSVCSGSFHQILMRSASRVALRVGKNSEYTGAPRIRSYGRTLMRGDNYPMRSHKKSP